MRMRRILIDALARTGYELRKSPVHTDITIADADSVTIRAVSPFTMTSQERLLAACDAVRYTNQYAIPGAIVECGVWAGGTSMAMARTLLALGDTRRELWLYDTFKGMSMPTALDVDASGLDAATTMARMNEPWCYASVDTVRSNMKSTGYPQSRLHLVVGDVAETIPNYVPDQIAVLRLDTDWYESTRHELRYLMPRMADRSVLLIDDYGHWRGARRAVDEWISSCGFPVLLARTDYTGRMAIIAR